VATAYPKDGSETSTIPEPSSPDSRSRCTSIAPGAGRQNRGW
jgi:hypothetical protein